MKSPNSQDYIFIFNRLKTILAEHQESVVVTADDANSYSLETDYIPQYKKRLFFGAVHMKKNYVSYHLMPIYMYPDLLNSLSPELKKRMQGKSCFNFKKMDETLFLELDELTQRSVERLHSEGIL
jgi:hypothetical protein